MPNLFRETVLGFQWFVLWYFVALNLFYLVLIGVAAHGVRKYVARLRIDRGARLPPEFMKPFSVLIPAHNEEANIVESVTAILGLEYPEFELIVCDDGSTDRTLQSLIDAFQLEVVDVEQESRFPSTPVRRVYFSRLDYRLVVVTKENGGKADALNAAAGFARYPYVCAVDADSILAPDSMARLMRHFVAVPGMGAVGGVIRLANGCTIRMGRVERVGMPKKTIERIQVVEYMRAFLFGRLGWSQMNILMIISGAFGVFRQDLIERVRGWNTRAVGEDMELVLRLHRLVHTQNVLVKLGFSPDPVTWTQAPSTIRGLSVQRDRWQRALMQALFWNYSMFMNPRYGAVGVIGFPYFVIFEMLGAFVEFIGLPLTIVCFAMGIVDVHFFVLFLGVALLGGTAVSLAAVVLAERIYRRYESWNDLWLLFAAAISENFWYRSLHSFWRLKGMFKFLFLRNTGWGTIRREPLASSPLPEPAAIDE